MHSVTCHANWTHWKQRYSPALLGSLAAESSAQAETKEHNMWIQCVVYPEATVIHSAGTWGKPYAHRFSNCKDTSPKNPSLLLDSDSNSSLVQSLIQHIPASNPWLIYTSPGIQITKNQQHPFIVQNMYSVNVNNTTI